jgi:ubiquinone/menaquinone biosynthesis C-methylase UbiE
MTSPKIQLDTAQTYEKYAQETGAHRNSRLHNPEVIFQALAYDWAVIRALESTKTQPAITKVLDVGCGAGASLFNFIRMGYSPSNLTGLDIRGQELHRAAETFPNVNFICGDAANMEFPSESFDIVIESKILTGRTGVSEDLGRRIASEMLRVAKQHAFIILVDWRYKAPWDRDHLALSQRRIATLFQVPSATKIHQIFRGALVPPIGRLVSKRTPFLYFILQAFCPFLVGELAVVLRKK